MKNHEGRIPVNKNNKNNFCLHSQIIYGDLVETFEPYYRGYMKETFSFFNLQKAVYLTNLL